LFNFNFFGLRGPIIAANYDPESQMGAICEMTLHFIDDRRLQALLSQLLSSRPKGRLSSRKIKKAFDMLGKIPDEHRRRAERALARLKPRSLMHFIARDQILFALRGSGIALPSTTDFGEPADGKKPNSGILHLNFKIDADIHDKFKLVATLRRMSMKDLMLASFDTWLAVHGQDLKDKL
jgi:hypothetical protein